MSARSSRFSGFGSSRGKGKAAGVVVACAVLLLAGCGGSAADSADPVIRGDVPVAVAQFTLFVLPTPPSGTFGNDIVLITVGGSGDGVVTYTVTGTGCSVSATSVSATSSNATLPATCVVTATKAASTGYLEATSAATYFTFTDTPAVAQARLTVSNTTLTDAVDDGIGFALATLGGSGDGVVTYEVWGTGCSVSATSFNATPPATCVVNATKAASTGYLEATSARKTFRFTTS